MMSVFVLGCSGGRTQSSGREYSYESASSTRHFQILSCSYNNLKTIQACLPVLEKIW
jgi:hypothetical protein